MNTAKYLVSVSVRPCTKQNISELHRLKNTGANGAIQMRCPQNTESVIDQAINRELEIERARHKLLESNASTVKDHTIRGWHP